MNTTSTNYKQVDCFGEPLTTVANTPSETGAWNLDDDFTYLETEERTPSDYYSAWAEVVDYGKRYDQPTVILRTKRSGADGRFDARYLADRIASGLYWAEVRR